MSLGDIMLEHLRGLREDKDLSQSEMARILQVHQTTYSDYERGNLNIPIATLKQLALFHNTSIDYLLGMTDVREPYPRSKA